MAVGFGIKDAETAATVAGCADAVVVGSALVDCVAADYASNRNAATAIETANSLISTIRTGVNLATSK